MPPDSVHRIPALAPYRLNFYGPLWLVPPWALMAWTSLAWTPVAPYRLDHYGSLWSSWLGHIWLGRVNAQSNAPIA